MADVVQQFAALRVILEPGTDLVGARHCLGAGQAGEAFTAGLLGALLAHPALPGLAEDRRHLAAQLQRLEQLPFAAVEPGLVDAALEATGRQLRVVLMPVGQQRGLLVEHAITWSRAIDELARAGFRTAEGEQVTFALIPVTAVKYTYTVIPALVMTWCLSYIERWVDRITPAVTKNFLKPMLIVLIAAPLAILLIGPIGIWIGTAISGLVYTVHDYLGWLSVAIMGALWPLLVMTGMHRVFTPTIIQTIAETGKEGMVMPSEIGANLSLGGSSLAVAWRTKNPELRQTALAAAASAIMAGISEPALYGVALRLKRPLIASLISGFICGAVAGMAGLASHSMAAPGLFTSVQFFDPANPMSIAWVFAVMALSVVLSFVLTLVMGFEDIPVQEQASQTPARADAAMPGQPAASL